MSEQIPDLEWTPAAEVPAVYAALSKDHSPIHLDEAVARAQQLPGVILHGMYVFARLADHLDAHVSPSGGALARLSVRFADVSLPESPIRVSVADAGERDVRIEGHQDGRVVLTAGHAEWRTAEPA